MYKLWVCKNCTRKKKERNTSKCFWSVSRGVVLKSICESPVRSVNGDVTCLPSVWNVEVKPKHLVHSLLLLWLPVCSSALLFTWHCRLLCLAGAVRLNCFRVCSLTPFRTALALWDLASSLESRNWMISARRLLSCRGMFTFFSVSVI